MRYLCRLNPHSHAIGMGSMRPHCVQVGLSYLKPWRMFLKVYVNRAIITLLLQKISSSLYSRQNSKHFDTSHAFLHTKDHHLNSTYGNNCIVFDDNIARVANICCNGPEICLIVQCFKQKKCFLKQPLSSTDVGIFKLWRLSKHFKICRLSHIQSKYVLLPYG
jgi:hypothetical protein